MTQLSDRPRRRLIPEAPALLPRPRLIASRYRRLASLKQCKMERGDVLIIGCPESKNTPLRSMLSRAYPLKCGLPRDLMVKAEELARADVLVADTPSPTLGGPTGAAVVGA
jgi:hypothetical protein